MSDEIVKMTEKLASLGEKIEQDMATKTELKQFADLVSGLSKQMDQQKLASERAGFKPSPVFASKAQAMQFIEVMQGAIAKSNQNIPNDFEKSEFYINKSNLNETTNTGGQFIPTSVSSTFSMMLAQGAVNRQYCTVYNGVQGTLDLTKRSGTSTAVFTAADETDVTPSAFGTAKVSLTPKQISALSLVSDKLLFASAVNVAEAVAIDLTEQAGVLEDTAVIAGDGTSTYGSVTGLNTAASVGEKTVSLTNFALTAGLQAVLDLPAQTHESIYSSTNARYYMSGKIYSYLSQRLASTSGVFHFDPENRFFTLNGYPIVLWHRMDNSAAVGKYPVFFGDLAKSTTVGIGRDMSLVADRSFKFGSNQTAFRLTYDWHAVHVQPSAMARLSIYTA